MIPNLPVIGKTRLNWKSTENFICETYFALIHPQVVLNQQSTATRLRKQRGVDFSLKHIGYERNTIENLVADIIYYCGTCQGSTKI